MNESTNVLSTCLVEADALTFPVELLGSCFMTKDFAAATLVVELTLPVAWVTERVRKNVIKVCEIQSSSNPYK